MKSDGGYTRQYRRLWQHPAFRNKQEAAVFSWMKDAAQWRPGCVNTPAGPVHLDVGELVIAERDLAEDFGLARSTLRRLIERMIAEKMIEIFLVQDRTIRRTNGGTIVRILKYKEYQEVNDDKNPAQDHPQDHALVRSRTIHIDKERKEKTLRETEVSLVASADADTSATQENPDAKRARQKPDKPGKAQIDAEFVVLWKRYPPKRRGGKADARRRYEIARRAESADDILRRTDRYLKQRAGEEERFTALLSGFLHRGYCMDEEDTPEPTGVWRDPGPDEPPPIADLRRYVPTGDPH